MVLIMGSCIILVLLIDFCTIHGITHWVMHYIGVTHLGMYNIWYYSLSDYYIGITHCNMPNIWYYSLSPVLYWYYSLRYYNIWYYSLSPVLYWYYSLRYYNIWYYSLSPVLYWYYSLRYVQYMVLLTESCIILVLLIEVLPYMVLLIDSCIILVLLIAVCTVYGITHWVVYYIDATHWEGKDLLAMHDGLGDLVVRQVVCPWLSWVILANNIHAIQVYYIHVSADNWARRNHE